MKYKSEIRAVHGGRGKYIDRTDTGILDFSANINPFPPEIDLSVPVDALARYPDDEYSLLKDTIARHHGCQPENITVGNGSVEVIRTLCHTTLEPGSTFHVSPHTFSEYELSAKLAGAVKVENENKSSLSFICNPDNPSGNLIQKSVLRAKISEYEQNERIICIDEAFIDLADPGQSVSDIKSPALFVLRSLTKSFAIPGIRFGYGIGDPDLVSAMEVMRPPWTVNAFAEKVVLSAFAKYNELERSRAYIQKEKEKLIEAITFHGWSCHPASANYLLIETGHDAGTITDLFFQSGILVRDCTSFHLPTCIRVAVRTTEENIRLKEAFEKVMKCLR